MTTFTVNVTLTVLGPFLTAAPSPDVYGLDRIFHRDHQGQLIIPDTHMKGKLRSALEELASLHVAQVTHDDIAAWFGMESTAGTYTPIPSALKFSNFVCREQPQTNQTHTRTAIHAITGTAAENQLRTFERAFDSGAQTTWTGTVKFTVADAAVAQRIVTALRLGLGWLATLGGEQGIGYGRLRTAQVGQAVAAKRNTNAPASTGAQGLHLRIQPKEPIMVGGVKKPRTNFVDSESVLPGALVKGALAAALNRTHNMTPVYAPLTTAHAAQYRGYEELVTHYSEIRVTHAFPVHAGKPRSVRVPISAAEINGVLKDTALIADAYPLVKGQAPVYFVDWKTPHTYFGGADPRTMTLTRTEIDDRTRRAFSGRLFSHTALCPVDDDGNTVEWVCNVDFSRIADNKTREAVQTQFANAAQRYLTRLGKGGKTVQVEVNSGQADAAMGRYPAPGDLVLVTLQTDTVMLDPNNVRSLAVGSDLNALYGDYWRLLSDDGSGPALVLKDFYAYQNFAGGYRYHRYLGAAERRSAPNRYRPFYLTGAGSVFKLEVTDANRAWQILDQWTQQGLDLPAWAVTEYGRSGFALWQTCPYLPENGYGEIAVNLRWHWDEQI